MKRKNILGILCLIIVIIMICINISNVYANNEEDNHIDDEVNTYLGLNGNADYAAVFQNNSSNDISQAFLKYFDVQNLINTKAEIDLAITYLKEIVNYKYWSKPDPNYPPRVEYPLGSGKLYGDIDPIAFDGSVSVDKEYLNNRKGSFGDLTKILINEMQEKYELNKEQENQLNEIEAENQNVIESDRREEEIANEIYDNNYHPQDEVDKNQDKEYTISGTVIRPGGSSVNGSDITSPADNPEDYRPGEMGDNVTLVKLGGIITGGLKIVGIIASVLILVILGIKYMTGTIQEKAEYKKTMIPYIVGAVFLGAGGVLIELIFNLVSGLTF